MSATHAAEASPGDRQPLKTDTHVGRRIRARRHQLGVTQEVLARQLGLTFQQVQKYERGVNRVSASKLWEIARALEVPVEWFFVGLEGGAEGGAEGVAPSQADQLLTVVGGLEIARIYPALARPRKQALLGVLRALADEPD